MKLLLFLLTIIFITPIKVNAQTDLEEWQYNLLERSTYYINDEIYNEIQEIDGEYYLFENVGVIYLTGIENWVRSSSGYFRLSMYIPGYLDPHDNYRDDIRSNYYDYITKMNVTNGFAYNLILGGAPLIYITELSVNSLEEFREFLQENDIKIYYKLTETKITHIEWYDPTPPAPEPEINYSYLIMPTLFIISVVGYIIVRKKVII